MLKNSPFSNEAPFFVITVTQILNITLYFVLSDYGTLYFNVPFRKLPNQKSAHLKHENLINVTNIPFSILEYFYIGLFIFIHGAYELENDVNIIS